MYADDLVIFCPYSAGLQQMLKICSEYGVEFDVKKSDVMIIKVKDDRKFYFPQFYLSGKVLNVCSVAKYLGHFCNDDPSDDKDIARQCCKLYAQGNTLVRKFHMYTPEVKVNQFRTYCTPLYTAHLWFNYCKYSMNGLKVAYSDAMRMLLRIPRYISVSQMFAELPVPARQAVGRNLMFKFITRPDRSENSIISYLVSPA